MMASPPTEPPQEVYVHFMRHFTAVHKDVVFDETIPDPDLSIQGELEGERFQAENEDFINSITHIISSPMSRAIQTARVAFPDSIRKDIQIIALPELQNMDTGPCGTGLDLPDFEKAFGKEVDLRGMCEGWNIKDKGRWSRRELQSRLQTLRGLILGLVLASSGTRVEILLISHGSVLAKLAHEDTYPSMRFKSFLFDGQREFQQVDYNDVKKWREEWASYEG